MDTEFRPKNATLRKLQRSFRSNAPTLDTLRSEAGLLRQYLNHMVGDTVKVDLIEKALYGRALARYRQLRSGGQRTAARSGTKRTEPEGGHTDDGAQSSKRAKTSESDSDEIEIEEDDADLQGVLGAPELPSELAYLLFQEKGNQILTRLAGMAMVSSSSSSSSSSSTAQKDQRPANSIDPNYKRPLCFKTHPVDMTDPVLYDAEVQTCLAAAFEHNTCDPMVAYYMGWTKRPYTRGVTRESENSADGLITPFAYLFYTPFTPMIFAETMLSILLTSPLGAFPEEDIATELVDFMVYSNGSPPSLPDAVAYLEERVIDLAKMLESENDLTSVGQELPVMVTLHQYLHSKYLHLLHVPNGWLRDLVMLEVRALEIALDLVYSVVKIAEEYDLVGNITHIHIQHLCSGSSAWIPSKIKQTDGIFAIVEKATAMNAAFDVFQPSLIHNAFSLRKWARKFVSEDLPAEFDRLYSEHGRMRANYRRISKVTADSLDRGTDLQPNVLKMEELQSSMGSSIFHVPELIAEAAAIALVGAFPALRRIHRIIVPLKDMQKGTERALIDRQLIQLATVMSSSMNIAFARHAELPKTSDDDFFNVMIPFLVSIDSEDGTASMIAREGWELLGQTLPVSPSARVFSDKSLRMIREIYPYDKAQSIEQVVAVLVNRRGRSNLNLLPMVSAFRKIKSSIGEMSEKTSLDQLSWYLDQLGCLVLLPLESSDPELHKRRSIENAISKDRKFSHFPGKPNESLVRAATKLLILMTVNYQEAISPLIFYVIRYVLPGLTLVDYPFRYGMFPKLMEQQLGLVRLKFTETGRAVKIASTYYKACREGWTRLKFLVELDLLPRYMRITDSMGTLSMADCDVKHDLKNVQLDPDQDGVGVEIYKELESIHAAHSSEWQAFSRHK